jgi:hypothetical protein
MPLPIASSVVMSLSGDSLIAERRTKNFAPDLVTVGGQRRAMNADRLVGDDVANERNEPRGRRAVPRAARMKRQSVEHLVRNLYAARAQMRRDRASDQMLSASSMRLSSLASFSSVNQKALVLRSRRRADTSSKKYPGVSLRDFARRSRVASRVRAGRFPSG